MPIDSKGLRQEAEELAIALELGLTSIDEVVAWADRNIVAIDQPPYMLIEVSSSGKSSPPDVIRLLRAIPGPVDAPRAARRIIGRIAAGLEEGRFTPERAARLLVAMEWHDLAPDSATGRQIVALDDTLDLVHAGISHLSLAEANELVREFLKKYLE